MRTRCSFVLMCVVAVLGAAGCSAGTPKGTIAGRVSYRGEPVTEGDVGLMLVERGIGAAAKLDDQGRFRVDTPVDVGVYHVSVHPIPAQPTPAGVAKAPVKISKIPVKARDPYKSGIKITVQPGDNDFAIELKD